MSDNVEDSKFATYLLAGGLVALYSVVQYIEARKRDVSFCNPCCRHRIPHDCGHIPQVKVPAIGPSGALTSYYGAVKYVLQAKEMLQEGYDKVHSTHHIVFPVTRD